MKRKQITHVMAVLFASGLLLAPQAFAASERESLETLRQTTLNLINVLVEQGVMTREKADKLVKAAEAQAAATVAEQNKTAAATAGAVGAVSGAALASAGQEKAQILTTAEKGRTRVTYIPESVKNELREQIRQDVLAQAKTERWGEPNALPEWIDRIKWEGDIRVRSQSEMMDKRNAPNTSYVGANTNKQIGDTTRGADFGGGSLLTPSGNTLEDRERLRLRARLGMTAKVNDEVMAGFRMVTGSVTDRVSTNQTLGNNFNKYTLSLDRAYLKYEPTQWLSMSGGRIPNPFFSTDLVWDENLNFEGVAATFFRRDSRASFKPFITAGFFPIRDEQQPTKDARWLSGVQGGAEWDLSTRSRLKLGAAYYQYKNIEGVAQTNAAASNYGKSEYESGLRQKGNTLFRVNNSGGLTGDVGNVDSKWGLASKFAPLNFTGVLDLAHFDPTHIILTGDYVKNLGFDKAEIMRRTGLTSAQIPDGRDTGALVKLQFGYPKVERKHEWNASVAYRYLGSDAVLDAFTSSDFGLGGTNNKGYILGFNYGIERNTSVGIRWLSSDSIDSMVPLDKNNGNKATYGLDILQIDISASF